MDRRNFIKYSSLTSLALASTKLYAINNLSEQALNSQLFCQRTNTKLTVIYDVDLLYIGGTTAAVASAVAASKQGAKVCLISPEPYLGEDICGTLRFWDLLNNTKHPFTQKLLLNNGLPTPLHIKKTLDNELLEQDIPFLMSSYISNIFYDDKNRIAGVAIANRSGEQIIRTKIIIDATPLATVARLASLNFTKTKDTTKTYKYTVLGNNVKQDIPHLIQKEKVKTEKEELTAIQYTFSLKNIEDDMTGYAKAEQHIRERTWDIDQVDSSDLLFEIPKQSIITAQTENDKTPIHSINLNCLQSKENNFIYTLNGYGGMSIKKKEEFLLPDNYITNGIRLGSELANIASKLDKAAFSGANAKQSKIVDYCTVQVYLSEMRPNHTIEQIEIESEMIPVFGNYDVFVAGGGTAGAPAAIGAAQYGAKTLLSEYLHGLGGISTLGLIGRYWHGYREGFTKKMDDAIKAMGPADHVRQKKWRADFSIDWKMEYYRKEIIKAKGDIWFGTIVCGAIVENNMVKGVIVATPYGKGAILCNKVIDSTGSADVAIAAGAQYEYITADSVAVQGSGLPAVNPGEHYKNTDWTFINDNDVFDITRTYVAGKSKYNNSYDVGKLLQTRERRRIIGDYQVTALDMMNDRRFPDTFSVHISSFDTHGYTIDPFFSIKPPAGASVDMFAKVPLRSLLPKGIENIIVTGLGACAHRDAMPVIRMQPCLQTQGFSAGMLAAYSCKENTSFRTYNLKQLQKELVAMGNLPPDADQWTDTFPPTDEQVNNALKAISNDLDQLEVLLWDTAKGLAKLESAYKTTQQPEDKLLYAYILAFYNNPIGWKEVKAKIDSFDDWDEGWNYTGMGQFGKCGSYLDGLITALGNTKKTDALPSILRLARKLSTSSHLSHYKAITDALVSMGKNNESATILAMLIQMPGVSGYAATTLVKAKFFTNPSTTDTITRNMNLRELFLARALYICGDKDGIGKRILTDYSNDLRGHYAIHAREVLKNY
jgi:hypothetical protein